MDDVLLNDLETLDIIEKARKQCDADGKPKSHYQAYECHALCRAQVAKVTRWMSANNSAPTDSHPPTVYAEDLHI